MYILKRITAYLIDCVLVIAPLAAVLEGLAGRFGERILESPFLQSPIAWAVPLALPVLGTLTGLTGRTPGKLITFLKVEDGAGDPPGVAQGIVRELVKAFSLSFIFGAIWALQGLATGRRTFYDQWLDLEVDDLRPVGLTETQKKFRKYQREQERRRKRA